MNINIDILSIRQEREIYKKVSEECKKSGDQARRNNADARIKSYALMILAAGLAVGSVVGGALAGVSILAISLPVALFVSAAILGHDVYQVSRYNEEKSKVKDWGRSAVVGVGALWRNKDVAKAVDQAEAKAALQKTLVWKYLV